MTCPQHSHRREERLAAAIARSKEHRHDTYMRGREEALASAISSAFIGGESRSSHTRERERSHHSGTVHSRTHVCQRTVIVFTIHIGFTHAHTHTRTLTHTHTHTYTHAHTHQLRGYSPSPSPPPDVGYESHFSLPPPPPPPCLLYTSPSPRDATLSRMPSSA